VYVDSDVRWLAVGQATLLMLILDICLPSLQLKCWILEGEEDDMKLSLTEPLIHFLFQPPPHAALGRGHSNSGLAPLLGVKVDSRQPADRHVTCQQHADAYMPIYSLSAGTTLASSSFQSKPYLSLEGSITSTATG